MTPAEIARVKVGDRVRVGHHEFTVEWVVGGSLGGIRDDGWRVSTARLSEATLLTQRPPRRRKSITTVGVLAP